MQSTWRTAKHTKHGIALTSSKVLSPDRSGLLGKKEVLTNSSSGEKYFEECQKLNNDVTHRAAIFLLIVHRGTTWFHIGVPTWCWNKELSNDNHRRQTLLLKYCRIELEICRRSRQWRQACWSCPWYPEHILSRSKLLRSFSSRLTPPSCHSSPRPFSRTSCPCRWQGHEACWSRCPWYPEYKSTSYSTRGFCGRSPQGRLFLP